MNKKDKIIVFLRHKDQPPTTDNIMVEIYKQNVMIRLTEEDLEMVQLENLLARLNKKDIDKKSDKNNV